MWHKFAEPGVNFKSHKGGDRGKLSGPEGQYSKYAVFVDADYANREFILWFQNVIVDGEVRGDHAVRLPWKEADPWSFAAWNHEGVLKIAFVHWGNAHAERGTFGVYNTGYRTFQ